jgi:hypothetical protein
MEAIMLRTAVAVAAACIAVSTTIPSAQVERRVAPAKPKIVRLEPTPQRPPQPPRIATLSIARKSGFAKDAGVTVPPGGLQTETVLSPRFPYKGQVAYLVFKYGWLDTGADTFDFRGNGSLDLFLHVPKPSLVLAVVSAEMKGAGKFGYANYGPGEMGEAPSWIDIGANGEEHVPMVLDCPAAGWYRIALSVQISGTTTFKLRQIELSYLNP